MELVPHQLLLTKPQRMRLMKGHGVNIPHEQMGSDKGDTVVMLHPHNAKKMLGAYRRSKGMRLELSPMEMEATMSHGRGFSLTKAFKKLGSEAKKTFTPALGHEIASSLIHTGIPSVTGLIGDALAGPAGGVAGAVAGNMLANEVGKLSGHGLYGGAMPSPADAKKMYMKMIRSMKGMTEEEKEKVKGSGLFKMLHKVGISKGKVIKGVQDAGKKAIHHGATAIGTAIGAYTGNPVAGAMIGEAIGRAGEKGLDSIKPSKHGITFSPHEAVSSLKHDMKTLAKDELDTMIAEKVPAEYQELAYGAVNKVVGDGVKRGRGRPRKVTGKGVYQSKAFKQALSANYDGLILPSGEADNRPVSDFKVNPNVAPSSTEMTLSPYHSTSSPAMNPFIPTRYTQMGGTQSGYGGRGLYGP